MRTHNHRLAWNTRLANRFGVNNIKPVPPVPKPNLVPNSNRLQDWPRDSEIAVVVGEDGWVSAEYLGNGAPWFTTGNVMDLEVGKIYTFSIEIKAGTLDKTLVQFNSDQDFEGEGQTDVSTRKVGGTQANPVFWQMPPGGVEFQDLSPDDSVIIAITRKINVGIGGITKGNVTLRPGIWSQLRGTVWYRHPKVEEGSEYTGYVAGP